MGRGMYLPGLRRQRVRKAWTQADLAKAAGLSPSVIAKLEAQPDRKAADMSTIRKLAGALGVPVAELMDAEAR